ncbi:MAG: TetM/TetW/TetO/TetS family tetracycline resistance ribosomal protection protein [Lachnospiraceae bacterium]|nr:TetM/TetW/TetO/TetS family tetracycline resistance ribosomal protection protein [Lachnospiraceae bacterium]
MIVGIMAHVDAGKTTLSEALLYTSGAIKKAGRVDKRDAFLDTHDLEKDRGITIFSKEARFNYKDREYVLIDTPGHTDFIAETERTFKVLDACILVVSGAEKLKSHVIYLYRSLVMHGIPVVLFINKMDIPGADKGMVLRDLRKYTDTDIVDFTKVYEENESGALGKNPGLAEFYEEVATADESLLEEYLENGEISEDSIKNAIASGKLTPAFSGSALKFEGIKELLEGIYKFTVEKKYEEADNPSHLEGAENKSSDTEKNYIVYKITHDEKGQHLSHVKVISGELNTRQKLLDGKITELRKYSGKKFESVQTVKKGEVCAVLGVDLEPDRDDSNRSAVMNYRLILPEDVNVTDFMQRIKVLSEEDPELHISYLEEDKAIQVRLFGQVQKEVLKSILLKRFGIDVEFSKGKVCYRETIREEVFGAGHFEPLRHYAEVHLKLTPLKPGEGLKFKVEADNNNLPQNFRNLVISNLKETDIPGVLTGSPITDMLITLVDGRSHIKHTEGGDFRQAARRAVRQGLMKAENVLLEPWYNITLTLPQDMVGKVMNDVTKMSGKVEIIGNDEALSTLSVIIPVSEFENYQEELRSITRGEGSIDISFYGYLECHNAEEIIEEKAYNPLSDLEFSPDSVFCSHGSAVIVPWEESDMSMHVGSKEELIKNGLSEEEFSDFNLEKVSKTIKKERATDDELMEIFEKTYGTNKREVRYKYQRNYDKNVAKGNTYTDRESYEKIRKKKKIGKEKVMLVDGYNVIYSWEDLKELARDNLSAAREKLMDILANYAAFEGISLILVFDAYMVRGNVGEFIKYHNIEVIYTKEAQTADQYIAESSLKLGGLKDVTVATSDALVQLIILGHNCKLMSSRELKLDIEEKTKI